MRSGTELSQFLEVFLPTLSILAGDRKSFPKIPRVKIIEEEIAGFPMFLISLKMTFLYKDTVLM